MKKINNKQMEFLKDKFYIYDDKNSLEFERWTDGGVDMFIYIDKKENDNIIDALEKYINDFDIDDEIETYRQDKDYKEVFTIRQSIEDFERYINDINYIIKTLRGLK